MRLLVMILVSALIGCAATEPTEPEVTTRGLLETPQKLLGPGDILLDEETRFTDLRGGDVLAWPGVYHVEPHRSGGLLLVPADHVGRPLLVKAAPVADYEEPVRKAQALVLSEDYGELHVVFLAPTGKHLEAVGYTGDVRPRGAPRRVLAARVKAARTPRATLTVTAPKAKQKLQAGRGTTISWRKQGQQHALVRILLMRGRKLVETIASRAKNAGSYAWKVPADLPSGTYWLAIATLDRRVRGQSGEFSVVGAARPAAPTRFDVAQVRYSRRPGRIVETAAEAPKVGSAPPPLSDEEKAAAVQQVRMLAGIEATPQLPEALTEVTLTADKPRVGKCWYDVARGWNLPGGSEANPPIHSTIAQGYSSWGKYYSGRYNFHFEPVIPGKNYLVDCAVKSTPQTGYLARRWRTYGASYGTVFETDGHLLIAFKATDTVAEIQLEKMGPTSYSDQAQLFWALLFSAELTRVD
jgi:hypothetical protein